MKTGLPATIVFLTTLLVALWPVTENFRAKPHDNFPLSYYPMFRQKLSRETAVIVVEHFIGIRQDGSELNLPSKKVSPANRVHLRLLVNAGKSDDMCRAAAQRAKEAGRFRDLKSISLVRDRYLRNDFYSPPYKPFAREVHATVALSSLERK